MQDSGRSRGGLDDQEHAARGRSHVLSDLSVCDGEGADVALGASHDVPSVGRADRVTAVELDEPEASVSTPATVQATRCDMGEPTIQITVRGKPQVLPSIAVGGGTAIVRGGLLTTAEIFDEYWLELRNVPDPLRVLDDCKALARRPDLFTFAQRVPDVRPRFDFFMEPDNIAVVPLSSYDHWLSKQVTAATRRNIKAAMNRGVVVRAVEFDDAYVRGIMSIYNETPIRQGRRFWHYGKDFTTVERENGTYKDRSTFLAAYVAGEMIGYLKIVWDERTAAIMQVLSKSSSYEKRPNNALIAEAVKLACARGIQHLQYEHFVYANKTSSSL